MFPGSEVKGSGMWAGRLRAIFCGSCGLSSWSGLLCHSGSGYCSETVQLFPELQSTNQGLDGQQKALGSSKEPLIPGALC